MKYVLVLLAFISFAPLSFAQQLEKNIVKENVIVGQTGTGADIKANRVSFPSHHITGYDIDTARNEVWVILQKLSKNKKRYKNDGYMASFSLSTGELIWSEPIKYFDALVSKKVAIRSYGEDCTVYDRRTGKVLWRENPRMTYIDDENNVAISANGTAHDLTTGEPVWKRKQKQQHAVVDVEKVDDQNVIFVTYDELQYINLKTGEGWDHEITSGKSDYTPVVAGAVAGVALGVLTGVAVVPTTPNMITHSCSNVLLDGDKIYFASRQKMLCLDKSGKLIWEKELPKGATRSILLPADNDIRLINLEYVYVNGRPQQAGYPYIISYDRNTGKENFVWDNDHKKGLKDYLVKEDTVTLMLDGKMSRLNLASGRVIKSKSFDGTKIKGAALMDGDKLLSEGNEYKTLSSLYPGNIFVNANGELLRFNEQLSMQEPISDNIFSKKRDHGDVSYYENEKRTLLFQNGQKIATLDGTNYSPINGGIAHIALEYFEVVEPDAISNTDQ